MLERNSTITLTEPFLVLSPECAFARFPMAMHHVCVFCAFTLATKVPSDGALPQPPSGYPRTLGDRSRQDVLGTIFVFTEKSGSCVKTQRSTWIWPGTRTQRHSVTHYPVYFQHLLCQSKRRRPHVAKTSEHNVLTVRTRCPSHEFSRFPLVPSRPCVPSLTFPPNNLCLSRHCTSLSCGCLSRVKGFWSWLHVFWSSPLEFTSFSFWTKQTLSFRRKKTSRTPSSR